MSILFCTNYYLATLFRFDSQYSVEKQRFIKQKKCSFFGAFQC